MLGRAEVNLCRSTWHLLPLQCRRMGKLWQTRAWFDAPNPWLNHRLSIHLTWGLSPMLGCAEANLCRSTWHLLPLQCRRVGKLRPTRAWFDAPTP